MQSISNYAELHSYLELHLSSVGLQADLKLKYTPAACHCITRIIQMSMCYCLSTSQTLSIETPGRISFMCVIYRHALARYIHYKYGTAALLHTRQKSFPNQEGTQQRNPLGMLLFSLVAQPLVLYIQLTFRVLLNL